MEISTWEKTKETMNQCPKRPKDYKHCIHNDTTGGPKPLLKASAVGVMRIGCGRLDLTQCMAISGRDKGCVMGMVDHKDSRVIPMVESRAD